MFCYQCEQTAKGTGCTAWGVCGKSPEVADLQDVLLYVTKGVSMYAARARRLGARDAGIDRFVLEALFTTITNVNFDEERMETMIRRAEAVRSEAKKLYEEACAKAGKTPETLGGPAAFALAPDRSGLIRQGGEVNPEAFAEKRGEVVQGLHDLVLLGLKGSAAYADHAAVLGHVDDEVMGFFHDFLDFLSAETFSVEELTGKALDAGKWNIRVMELLDGANTDTYGHPEPTSVRVTPVKGKAILVSGTTSAIWNCSLSRPKEKASTCIPTGRCFPAWPIRGSRNMPTSRETTAAPGRTSARSSTRFPDTILMTTNCIQKPKDSYLGRIFTTGLVAWPGAAHIGPEKDFSPVIEAALAAPGFAEDEPEHRILVGFGRNAVMGAAGKVIDLVKAGKIRHFFLVGGCDGAKPGASYYTDLAKQIPSDCVILTLACGKYRFNKLDFGDIEGIPRLLDVGQCNDAYSAVRIALALAEAFQTDVNGLPLSLVLSWYEQKAVCILLSLLHLGVKNMRIGPSLPAFVKPPSSRCSRRSSTSCPSPPPRRT
jgi:hydroxylamine reductase